MQRRVIRSATGIDGCAIARVPAVARAKPDLRQKEIVVTSIDVRQSGRYERAAGALCGGAW